MSLKPPSSRAPVADQATTASSSASAAFTYPDCPGGLPPQSASAEGRAIFTDAYAVIPRDVQRDITTSFLPGWQATRMWVLARPMTGFSETFSHYLVETTAGGGSDTTENDPSAEAVIFLTGGTLRLIIDGTAHDMAAGGYAFVPAGAAWSLHATGNTPAVWHWIRKRYVPAEGVSAPDAFVTSDADASPIPMPDCDGLWATTHFVDPADMRHDMHVNIVTFQPGGCIPFAETHVMEHGLFILQGTGDYLLNTSWVEVTAGDFLWLRAFCPQACTATGSEPFRYLLYKDVNRHMPLSLGGL